ncbi:carbohydrate-binding protein [Mariniflexile sp. AS56]|uniref:carbohydrate-binding protein n=1 Tax=Mariniflexile sp. AS56 TaxID=3063957 RepID=UPI0026EFFFE6|nr:carbohydrate-binding protein [Mariniflexile sp. AS56]MDO7171595.1 carbohydrate-binding protein [Mariniflexile sp. AS56]
MKKNDIIKQTKWLIIALFCVQFVQSQVTISSIAELNNLLAQDNVNAVMTPGTYNIGPADVTSGLLPNPTLFEFSGSNCTYDFTGVTFEFDTNIFRSFGNVEVIEMRVAGANNVIKNLKMEDIGSVTPYRTALGIQFDGLDNRIEGIHMTVRGSYPYGYGDIFGKGSGYVIKHFKHSAILVRGERNHIKNCTIIHRAYGHGIFCQGSIDALIEGTYLEGEVRSTDDVLAEAGSGSAADEKDFMTVWGHRLQPGWMFSLQEDGIRAYNNGSHHITGESISTRNMRVIDCTINKMRSGITIGFCDNEKYVENCEAIGTEGAFWVGNGGEIVNSRGDGAYGPLYASAYQTDNTSKVDITVIDSEYDVYGTHPLLFLGGSGHNISLKSTETTKKEAYKIFVAGVREGMRYSDTVDATYFDQSASNVTLSNASGYPIVLEERCTNATIHTCGTVTDNGTDNSVTLFADCADVDPNNLCPKTAALMEGECYDSMLGVQSETCAEGGLNIGYLDENDWVKFSAIDLSGMASVKARTSSKYSGGFIEVRLDATDGALIGNIPVNNTSGWQNWVTSAVGIQSFTGNIHDVYFVFKGTRAGSMFNVNWFSFSAESLSASSFELNNQISMYPNPVSDILTLSLANADLNIKQTKITLFNISGQKVMEIAPKSLSEVRIDVSELNSGMYFLKVGDVSKTGTKKIIKL